MYVHEKQGSKCLQCRGFKAITRPQPGCQSSLVIWVSKWLLVLRVKISSPSPSSCIWRSFAMLAGGQYNCCEKMCKVWGGTTDNPPRRRRRSSHVSSFSLSNFGIAHIRQFVCTIVRYIRAEFALSEGKSLTTPAGGEDCILATTREGGHPLSVVVELQSWLPVKVKKTMNWICQVTFHEQWRKHPHGVVVVVVLVGQLVSASMIFRLVLISVVKIGRKFACTWRSTNFKSDTPSLITRPPQRTIRMKEWEEFSFSDRNTKEKARGKKRSVKTVAIMMMMSYSSHSTFAADLVSLL